MFTLRSAEPKDLASVLELTQAFAASFVTDPFIFQGSYTSLLSSENTCFIVAEEQGRVWGYLLAFRHQTLFANGPVVWVEELMVQEDKRRRGMGRALMDRCEEWASSKGSRLIALATRRADLFYQNLGYEESATYFRKLLP